MKAGVSNQIDYNLVKSLIKKKKARILDIGCGAGFRTACLPKIFPHSTIFGIDLHQQLLESALRKKSAKGIQLVCGSAYSLPFANESFDLVEINATLWALPRPTLVISEARRVLRKGGILVIRNHDSTGLFHLTFPNHAKPALILEKALIKLFKSLGYDPFLGHKLFTLIQMSNFKVMDVDTSLIHFTGARHKPELKRKRLLVEQVTPQLIQRNLITKREISEGLRSHAKWIARKEAFSCRLYFTVYGKKL